MTAFGALPWIGVSPIFLVVAALAVTMVLLIMRLKRAHPLTWAQLGKPALLSFRGDYKGRWSLLQFLLGDAHRALNDSSLSALVWTMRGLIGATVVLLIVQIMNGGPLS